jgi:acyl carrier protein
VAIFDKVRDIAVSELGVTEEEVTPDARFVDDLGADSLDVVELIMKFEEEFDLEIPDEDAETLQTIQDSVDYIEKKLKEG